MNIIEHPELQDGSAKPWPAEVVATQVREFVQKNSVNSVSAIFYVFRADEVLLKGI